MTAEEKRMTRWGQSLRAALGVWIAICFGGSAPASHLGVESTGAPRIEAATREVMQTARVSWQNSWKNDRNHDAVWLFAKVRSGNGDSWFHPSVTSVEMLPTATDRFLAKISPDGRGVFLYPASTFRGDVSLSVRLSLDLKDLSRLRNLDALQVRLFGLEMVHIPGGSFFVGDPDPESLGFGGLFRSVGDGAPGGPLQIVSEEALEVGPDAGQLYYQVHTRARYEGDRQGPIPAAFPKGTLPFYIMKYEITQGQYAAFLNTLSRNATYFRANFTGRGYRESRGSIRLLGDSYSADRPQRPCNFLSWNDGAAFADWAALRPMTELEFTKASRGPSRPIAHEFPWGTDDKSDLLRRVATTDDLVTTGEADERLLSEATRARFGASYFWVMDLAGSVWERVVSLGHRDGRAFTGTHGDGHLSGYGFATNSDWPSGDENGGGYGYRGGGHYRHIDPEGSFNPHSPIAYRRFGAWGSGPRYIAYGYRGVRSDAP